MGIIFAVIGLFTGGLLLFSEDIIFKGAGVAILLFNFAALIAYLQKLL